MKKIIIAIIMMFIIPINVLASGSITPSTNNITIIKGGTATFTITASNAVGRIDISSANGNIATVDKTSEWIENQSITVVVTGVNVGATTINVRLSDAATFDEEELTGNYTINVAVKELSTNNNLNSITIDGKKISNFGSNLLSYSQTVPNSTTSVVIEAEKSDSKASVSGTGRKNLNVGNNSYNIEVTSESGAKKTYTVNITREAASNNNNSNNNNNNNNNNVPSTEKSKVNTLSEVKISNVDELKFESETTTYKIEVENEIKEVEIESKLTDAKSKYVEGYGNRKVELQEGNNKIEIKVEAENGEIKVYTFNITRKIKQYVKEISITGYDLKFSYDKTNYNLKIKEEEELKINVELIDSTNSYEIIGNEELKNGSIIKIPIKDQEGKELVNYEIKIRKTEEKKEDNKKGETNNYILPIVVLGVGIISIVSVMIYKKKRS